jgi:PAS domain S-box-containing protein
MFMSEKQPDKTGKESVQNVPFDCLDMLMNAPIGIFTSTPAGRFVYVNKALAQMIGYDAPQNMMDSIGDIGTQIYADPEDRRKVMRWLDDNDERLNNECRIVRKDGSQFWASYNVRAVRDGKGNIIQYEGFLINVTEKKQERESLLKTQFAVDMAPDGILWIDDGGGIVYANNAACTAMGYSREEMLAMKIFDIDPDFHPENFERFKKDVRQRGGMKLESRRRTKDGRVFPVEMSTRDFKFGDRYLAVTFDRDITERKRVEESLRESEEKYRGLVEGLDEILFRLTVPEGFYEYVSPEVMDVVGYSAGEIMANPLLIWNVIHPDFQDFFTEMVADVPKGKVPPTLEYKIIDSRGKERWILQSNKGIFDSQGKIVAVEGLCRDITRRKKTEEALRESEEKFRILAESTPTTVMLYQDDRYIYANRAAEIITGYSAEELRGMNFWEFIHSDYRAIVQERGRRRQQNKETINHYELKIVKKGGQEKWGYLSGATTTIGGRPAGIISVTDITDRRRTEEALRESERKYRFLTESMTDIVWTTDLNFRITYASPSIEKLLGFTPEERMRQNAEDTMTKESYETAMNLLVRELQTERDGTADPGRFLLVPTEYYHKKGHTVWVESMVRFIRDHEGNPVGIHGLSRDITERRRAEEEREKLKEQLNRSQKMESIGTLAGGIAHDFNNLLMGIQGNASLMMLDLDPSDPLYERLKHIEEQVRSGADLTKQLLGFARGGRYELKPADMNEIVERTAVMFGRTRKELTIHKKYEKDLRAVAADRTQMGQVFMNLLLNAWQAMPGGGEIFLETGNLLLDDAKACPLALSAGKYIRIAVSDTGTGMDEKTLERIFDPFFTTKEMGRGTGLGLATVYGIIKGHGGVIHVASKPGLGTTFEIYLPATEKAVAGKAPAESEILRGTETLLLIDDEPMVLDVTRSMLQSLGYRVFSAGNGREAMAVYREKRSEIDLVILDMIMPGISGSDIFDGLREINPKQRVLLSSGYSIHGKAKEMLERGCSGFLQKPFLLKDLAREVRTILDVKKEPS